MLDLLNSFNRRLLTRSAGVTLLAAAAAAADGTDRGWFGTTSFICESITQRLMILWALEGGGWDPPSSACRDYLRLDCWSSFVSKTAGFSCLPGAESVNKRFFFFFPPSRRIGGWMSTDHRLCLVPSILTFPWLDDFFFSTCFLSIIEIYTLLL